MDKFDRWRYESWPGEEKMECRVCGGQDTSEDDEPCDECGGSGYYE